MTTNNDELRNIVLQLRMQHDVLPFMTGLLPAHSLSLRLLPDEMRGVLEASADYQSPAPGIGPVWLQLSGEGDAEVASLIIYRSLGDGSLYVMAPAAP